MTGRQAGKINRKTLKLNCELSLMHLKSVHAQERVQMWGGGHCGAMPMSDGRMNGYHWQVSRCSALFRATTPEPIPLTIPDFSCGTRARAREMPRTENWKSSVSRGLCNAANGAWQSGLLLLICVSWPKGSICLWLFLPCKAAISDVESTNIFPVQ